MRTLWVLVPLVAVALVSCAGTEPEPKPRVVVTKAPTPTPTPLAVTARAIYQQAASTGVGKDHGSSSHADLSVSYDALRLQLQNLLRGARDDTSADVSLWAAKAAQCARLYEETSKHEPNPFAETPAPDDNNGWEAAACAADLDKMVKP